MAHQFEERTRDEVLLAEEATGRDMAGVVDDLNDQLTTIRAYANLGEEVSYDAELTESYFALIESSGKKAVLLTRELLALEPTRPSSEGGRTSAIARPASQQTASLTNEPPQTASSFRRRLGLTS